MAASQRAAARDAARRPALPALRRPAEDRPQPVALGPLVAAAVRAPARCLPVVRAVPRREGPAAADVADRSRQAAARPRPDRVRQLRRRDRQAPTSAAAGAARSRACSTSPAWRAPSTRTTRSSRRAVYGAAARQGALQCAACGAALPEGETMSCSQCGATLAITSLADAHAEVQALAPALRAAAERPRRRSSSAASTRSPRTCRGGASGSRGWRPTPPSERRRPSHAWGGAAATTSTGLAAARRHEPACAPS